MRGWMKSAVAAVGAGAWLTMATVTAAQPVAAPWPHWRGPAYNGISADAQWYAPGAQPRKVWEASVGTGYSTVAVLDGKLYTMGWRDGQDSVQCLDAVTGKPIWSFQYAAPLNNNSHAGGPSATPTIHDGKIYTLSRDLQIHCADITQGKVLWTRKLKADYGAKTPSWGFSGSVLVWGDTAYVEAGRTLALDKNTGKEKWKTEDYGAGYSTPQPFELDGKKLLAVFNAFGLVVLDAQSGKELAKSRWETSYSVNAATPIVTGNRIFISSGYGRGCALLEFKDNTLTTLWENKNMSNHMASSVLIDGHLYGFDEGRLRCIELAGGESKWMQRGLGKGTLTAAGGTLAVLSEKGEMLIAPADPAAFTPAVRFQGVTSSHPVWVAPVIAEGRLFARSPEGNLLCWDLSGK